MIIDEYFSTQPFTIEGKVQVSVPDNNIFWRSIPDIIRERYETSKTLNKLKEIALSKSKETFYVQDQFRKVDEFRDEYYNRFPSPKSKSIRDID